MILALSTGGANDFLKDFTCGTGKPHNVRLLIGSDVTLIIVHGGDKGYGSLVQQLLLRNGATVYAYQRFRDIQMIDTSSSISSTLVQHWMDTLKRFPCMLCSLLFDTVNDKHRHLDSHHAQDLCRHCSYYYQPLDAHQRHQCPVYSRRLCRQELLDKHTREMHPTCDPCLCGGKRWANDTAMWEHQKEFLTCYRCSERFKTQDALQRHIEDKHWIPCEAPGCKKKF